MQRGLGRGCGLRSLGLRVEDITQRVKGIYIYIHIGVCASRFSGFRVIYAYAFSG